MKTHHVAPPRTSPRLRGRRWLSALLAAVSVFALTPRADADIAQTVDAGDVSGAIAVDADGRLTLTPEEGEPQTMDLADVHRIVLGDNLVIRSGDVLLLDGNHSAVASETIKLRAGLHHIVLPYWQGVTNRRLEFHASGPGLPGGEIPSTHFYCYRDADQAPEPSIGFDEQGFRLPELSADALEGGDLRRRIRYTYLVGDGSGQWEDMSAFSHMEHKRGGVAGGITYRMAGQSEYFGLIFTGFIRIPEDGEYTFSLSADDGARLYFGQAEQFNAALPPSVEAPEWAVVTPHGTRLSGKLDELSDIDATLTVPVNEDSDLTVTLGLDQVAELWDATVDRATLELDAPAETEDTAYVRDRNNPDDVLTVPGTLVGLDAEKLHFDYRGQVRHINRDRVIGLVLNSADRPRAEALGYHQTLHLKTGQVFPGRLASLDGDQVTFAIAGATAGDGAETVTLPRDDVFMIRNAQGRVLDLTAMPPTAVEEVPFFNHVIPYRINTAFDGGPIRLFDGNEYALGFAVHSKNRLHYRLDGQFTAFRAGVGLLKPEGRLGNITARIIGDGKVLWEQADITADSGVVEVDVDLTGVERLIIETDFGAGQNVGDRAAWVNPQLIRDTVQ